MDTWQSSTFPRPRAMSLCAIWSGHVFKRRPKGADSGLSFDLESRLEVAGGALCRRLDSPPMTQLSDVTRMGLCLWQETQTVLDRINKAFKVFKLLISLLFVSIFLCGFFPKQFKSLEKSALSEYSAH